MIAPIKRYYVDDPMDNDYELIESVGGDIVLHSDHLASHAFDEAVEREAAFAACPANIDWGSFWLGWKYLAKSRTKRAVVEE